MRQDEGELVVVGDVLIEESLRHEDVARKGLSDERVRDGRVNQNVVPVVSVESLDGCYPSLDLGLLQEVRLGELLRRGVDVVDGRSFVVGHALLNGLLQLGVGFFQRDSTKTIRNRGHAPQISMMGIFVVRKASRAQNSVENTVGRPRSRRLVDGARFHAGGLLFDVRDAVVRQHGRKHVPLLFLGVSHEIYDSLLIAEPIHRDRHERNTKGFDRFEDYLLPSPPFVALGTAAACAGGRLRADDFGGFDAFRSGIAGSGLYRGGMEPYPGTVRSSVQRCEGFAPRSKGRRGENGKTTVAYRICGR